ncbi:demethoxyubiquinone hydroxylase family protein [Roseibium marinum]|uniref:Uncharacterized protein n=1 Tax=Roseibium marinum TaxID=281252 RepID=A0A2S3USL3_9HYPH|nr:demethoxyubiquinone hydroxylase family protein [Roseibium marinum]POF30560.1 hypothetical protein CLV41_106174 [Roseibium marinum]
MSYNEIFSNFVPSWNSIEKFRNTIGPRSLYVTYAAPFLVNAFKNSEDWQSNIEKNSTIVLSIILLILSDRILSTYKPEYLRSINDRNFNTLKEKSEAVESTMKNIISIDSHYKKYLDELVEDAVDQPHHEEMKKKIREFRIKADISKLLAGFLVEISPKAQRTLNKENPTLRLIILFGLISSIALATMEALNATGYVLNFLIDFFQNN